MTADELRAIIKDLPPVEGWDTWSEHRRALRKHILTQDPQAFLQWSTVSATMRVNNAYFIRSEYEALKPDWGRWMKAVRHSGFGSDTFYVNGGYANDPNLIHQAYHLSQWERVTGQRMNDLKRVVEFGGGYGAMCLVCRRLGFRGKYWIDDLSELRLLQIYYLHSTIGIENIHFYSTPYQTDLFIASHSLSEIPLKERDKLLRGLDAGSFLFVFHCAHEGIDNLAWFRQFAKERPEYSWQQWYTKHLPNQWYQIGVRND